jgi:hypothetical protein
MNKFDLDVFKRQLAETTAWCSQPNIYADGKYSFRQFAFMKSSAEWLDCILTEDRDYCIKSMIEERRKLLHNKNIPVAPLNVDLSGGRLLVFFPDQTLRDGVATVESNGFFGLGDFPPQDTWIYYSSDIWLLHKQNSLYKYLISWVPREYFLAIENTMNMNAAEHIMWLTDLEEYDLAAPFVDLLKQEGLFR